MNKCDVCGFLNRDDYDICQDCGTRMFPEVEEKNKMEKINIIKDLKEIKEIDLKEQVLNIIAMWKIQVREQKKEFSTQFLSDESDKYFNDLKKLIGEFKYLKKEIGEISVLNFMGNIIIGMDLDIKFFKDMHSEFKKMSKSGGIDYDNKYIKKVMEKWKK